MQHEDHQKGDIQEVGKGVISDGLRAWVASHSPNDSGVCMVSDLAVSELLEIADRIDREHSVRMEQSRRDMRKATCRYIATVVEDYKHGCKRVRKHHATRKDG